MKKEEFEAIIKEINEAKCFSLHAVEDDCELFAKTNPTQVAAGLNVDKHRWYEISTNIYKVGDWFLGVRGASHLFSEEMDFSDAGVETTAFEMEEVPSVTYKKKE